MANMDLVEFNERYSIKITDPTEDNTYSLCDNDASFDFKVIFGLNKKLKPEYTRIDAVDDLDELVKWFCKRHSDLTPKDAKYCLFWSISIAVTVKKMSEELR